MLVKKSLSTALNLTRLSSHNTLTFLPRSKSILLAITFPISLHLRGHHSVLTAPYKMPSVVAAVFGTPKLLVMILGALPIADLLRAQRISHQIQITIAGTKKLQQALFFEPKLCFDPRSTSQAIGTEINSLLVARFPVWFTDWQHREDCKAAASDSSSAICGLELSTSQLDALTRHDASWRKMLICQPPLQKLQIQGCFEIKYTRSTYPIQSTYLDHADTGLRMGKLHDIVWSCFSIGTIFVKGVDRMRAGRSFRSSFYLF